MSSTLLFGVLSEKAFGICGHILEDVQNLLPTSINTILSLHGYLNYAKYKVKLLSVLSLILFSVHISIIYYDRRIFFIKKKMKYLLKNKWDYKSQNAAALQSF